MQTMDPETGAMHASAKRLYLPPGAEQIVRSIAAEQLLSLMFQELPDLRSAIPNEIDFMQNPTTTQPDCWPKAVEALVREFPSTCQRMYAVRMDDGCQEEAMYPLSIILHFQPTLALVRAIFQAYPPALGCRSGGKRLRPLDIACIGSAPLNVLEFLHSLDTTVVSTPADVTNGWYPLHFACRHGSAHDVLAFLIACSPEAAQRIERVHGHSPLHLALLGGGSLATITALREAFPQSVLWCDAQNRTPLHLACRHQVVGLDVVSHLVAAAPQALSIVSLGGWTPRQLAEACQLAPVKALLRGHRARP